MNYGDNVMIGLDVVGHQTAARQDYPVLWARSLTGRGTAKVRFPQICGKLHLLAVKKLTTKQTMQGYVLAFDATDGSVVRVYGITSLIRGWSRYAFSALNSPWSVTRVSKSRLTEITFAEIFLGASCTS